MVSDRLSRRGCLFLLLTYGLLLVVLTVGHLYLDLDTATHLLLDLTIPGGLTILFFGVVYRISRADIDDDLLSNLVRWCFGWAGFVLLVTVPTMWYMGLPLRGHEASFGYLFALSLGGVGGLFMGYHEAKAVTEARHKTEAETERQQLEHLNQLLRHDVFNNLTVIEGNLELILDDPQSEETIDRLETIRRQARQATDHIENVRILVQSARDDQPLERINLSSHVESELSHIRDTYPNAQLTTTVPPDVYVRADNLLGSIIENLVRNAITHNDADTPRVTVSVEPADETVTMTVSDNGPGIPRAVRESLYHPPAESAHGLGLHLVKTLVERYHGSISIPESTSEGTTIVVELPRA